MFGGPPPSQEYDFVQVSSPDYVLLGEFARGTSIYPGDVLAASYELTTRIGGYELYRRKE